MVVFTLTIKSIKMIDYSCVCLELSLLRHCVLIKVGLIYTRMDQHNNIKVFEYDRELTLGRARQGGAGLHEVEVSAGQVGRTGRGRVTWMHSQRVGAHQAREIPGSKKGSSA